MMLICGDCYNSKNGWGLGTTINMAEQKTELAYRNIELYKSQSLGSGSYGGVCKAKCDGLLCAAKIMHPTLFDLHDTGAVSYLSKFHEECHLLSLTKHPNIVQYLATCYDPDTRLPVLLMELCDESLGAFLERSPGPLSYHVQLNICHDIALALVYLHSNGLIHRDLTGNNVLMIAGPRAKITDFGMSKLASVNPRMTLCPGNPQYMSPEALDEAKTYTAKLDVFSFGVVVIQILTRQFPNPTDRFRAVHEQRNEEESEDEEDDSEVRQLVPETERREAHLKLIPDAHSLRPLAVQCLKKKERRRPSALQLSERLSELKQSTPYRESMHQTQSSSDIQQLQQQLQDMTVAKTTEVEEHQTRITELESMVEVKNRQLQAKDTQLQENQHTKERELQQTRGQLRASEQLVSEFQQSLQQKDKTITDLQQTISAHERKIQQLEQQDEASRHQPQQQPVTTPHTTVAAAQKETKWREGKNAPEEMARGAALVHADTAYFRPFASSKVYSYENIVGQERWSQLPDNPNQIFGLAFIDGLLTSVGGINDDKFTKSLFGLTEEGERKQWCEIFPPMPTPRASTACVTMKQALVVAGGFDGSDLAAVEVMNIDTKQWTTVSPLPQKQSPLSGIVCGDTLYLAGGYIDINTESKSVFTCSIPDLLTSSNSVGLSQSQNIWKEVSSLPVVASTLASLNGNLLAIGGSDDSGNHISDVYSYEPHTNSWNVVSQMKIKRSWCFAVTLSGDRLVVVGGSTQGYGSPDSVEILHDH